MMKYTDMKKFIGKINYSKPSLDVSRRPYRRADIPVIEEPVSTKIWRKFRVNAQDALKIFEHFEARTPFAQVTSEIVVNIDTLNRMFASGWRNDLAYLREEMQGWVGPKTINAAGEVMKNDPVRPALRASARTIADVRALLHLGIAPDDVRAYLQLDRDTFVSALNRINLVGQSAS
jgi:hypothetical protein